MKHTRFSPWLLRCLRNRIPIDELIANDLDIPSKESEGYLRFLCPVCSEFNTATNPITNLGRCFRCKRNFNPIDVVMVVKQCSFVDAVKLLKEILPRYDSLPNHNPRSGVSLCSESITYSGKTRVKQWGT